MTKKILVLLLMLAAGVSSVPLLHAQDPKVMPPQYAGVANMSYSDSVTYGQSTYWSRIYLWGRTTNTTYIDNGYSYSWDYGDGSAVQPWTAIISYNSYDNFHPSSEYLCSDQHTYPAITTDKKYFTATLRIANSANVIVSSATLQVTKMDFRYVDTAHGYDANDIPIVKRTFVESITKGKGFTGLYLRQDRSGGNADGSLPGLINWQTDAFHTYTNYVPVVGTALAMQDFLLNRHSIYDPTGAVDPYYDCVVKGMNYIFRNGKILPAASIFGSSSDMNGNGTMIKFTGTAWVTTGYFPYVYTEMVQHGLCMQTLALFHNSVDSGTIVNIGPFPGTPMFLSDVVKDAVDLAINAQHDGSNKGWGWRIDETSQAQTSLWDTGAIVGGLESIEQKWFIKAPSLVRERLVHLVKSMQNQWGGPGGVVPGNLEIGSGNDTCACPYSDGFFPGDPAWTPGFSVNGSYSGTADLLAVMHYLSLDTSATPVCGCAPSNASSVCNAQSTDFKLSYNPSTGDYTGSCNRVMAVINWFGWHSGAASTWFYIYTPYKYAQLFRSYNYVKGGVNDGMLCNDYTTPNQSLPCLSGSSFSWEADFSTQVTALMETNGKIYERSVGYSDISTSWALNAISYSGYSSEQTIKTKNECPHTIMEARIFRPFAGRYLY